MKIEQVKIGDIKPNPSNPRLIKDDKFRKLVKSIQEFPQMMEIRPIVVNDDMVILGGNMRWKAAKEAGMKAVPVIKASELTEDQQREFIIKDNVGFGEWDWEDLANNWDTEKLEDWGLDIPDFKIEAQATEDDYEIPDEIKTDIVPGDLFEIGPHRLLCGDSTNADDVARLMNGEKADIMLTDPPYCSGGFQEAGKKSGSIGTRGKKMIANDTLSTRGYIALIKGMLSNIDPGIAYIFTDWRMWINLFDVAESCGYGVRNMIVWDKGTPGMGVGWRSQHEIILCGVKVTSPFNPKKAQGNVIKSNRTGNVNHPTEKPVDLLGAVMDVNDFAKIIADPFLGSGSTMVAAHQLGWKCYGMELDPKYCQVIVDRMRKLDLGLSIKRNGQDYN
jgi:DNA modification methylase